MLFVRKMKDITNTEYFDMLLSIKQRINLAQKRAILSASGEMLRLYWDVGRILQTNIEKAKWGDKILDKLCNDLKNEYPSIKGFTTRNCRYMMQFYREYNQELTFVKPPVSQIIDSNTNENEKRPVSQLEQPKFILPITHISWAHNVLLMQRVKSLDARYWYMVQTIKNSWGRDFLSEAIRDDYYGKQGALPNNFDTTLPEIQSKQVKDMLKDPYVFDMLTFTDEYSERDIELGLIKHIEKFLMELGNGFAFLGRQYHIVVSDTDYYIDLLFYHTFTHRYVVV